MFWLIDAEHPLAHGRLILMEVLQGTSKSIISMPRRTGLLQASDSIAIVGSSRGNRWLRRFFVTGCAGHGITVRKTIDTLIATRCIIDNIPLLFADRDFDPFVTHLGLRSALDES